MGEKPKLLAYEFDAEQYDTIIFGTPVWASCFTPPLRTFIHENQESLKEKRLAVYVCYSGGGADKAIDKLKKYLGINEFVAELILIDPAEQPSPENIKSINQFVCELGKREEI